jgi:hypothetical protein
MSVSHPSALPSYIGLAERLIPNTTKLNPFKLDGLLFLLSTGMLGRFGVGVTRTVADTPTLNSNEDQTPQEKTNIQLERFFMEFLGVPANFLALKLCEDLGAYVAMGVDGVLGGLFKNLPWGNQLHPAHLLKTLDPLLDSATEKAEKLQIAKALLMTYQEPYRREVHDWASRKSMPAVLPFWLLVSDGITLEQIKQCLKQDCHSLARVFNNNAKLDTFMQCLNKLNQFCHNGKGLNNETLEQRHPKTFKALNRHFRHNNIKTNLFILGTGLIGSTLFSGFVWQKLNDSVVRKRLVPAISPWLTKVYYGDKLTQRANANSYQQYETQEEALILSSLKNRHAYTQRLQTEPLTAIDDLKNDTLAMASAAQQEAASSLALQLNLPWLEATPEAVTPSVPSGTLNLKTSPLFSTAVVQQALNRHSVRPAYSLGRRGLVV